MTSRLDHIVVVAQSLESGATLVEAALGLRPGAGRKHPHMGTHNLLLALGPAVYLEVVAIDPDAAPVSRPRWFALDHIVSTPVARLAAWVASTDDIASDSCPELGAVETMEREGKTWQMTATADGSLPLAGAVPLLIQRRSPIHPAAVLRIEPPPSGTADTAPRSGSVSAVLARVHLYTEPKVTVTRGAAFALAAEIDTPFGLRALGDA